jgi:5-hydroxyisourate hydrolase
VSGISTHVLDLARGRPASGIEAVLERRDGEQWSELARGTTDTDGRLLLVPDGVALVAGAHRLTFALAPYFAARGGATFFPEASIAFEVGAVNEKYHVPLLLSPFGYSTYRGS